MKDHVVLRVIAKLLIPLILLFGLYVQIHGEYSTAGGFHAGVLVAAGLVLYSLISRLDAAHQVVTPRIAAILAAAGALVYGAVGVWSMLARGNYLEYEVLAASAQTGETVRIVLIELGVGITV